MLSVLRHLGGGKLGLHGLMSGFEGLNEGDVSCLEWPHPRPHYALPCAANSVARTTAKVDFPAPALELAKTMVGMADETADELLTNNKR
jgi:hypothetical protein